MCVLTPVANGLSAASMTFNGTGLLYIETSHQSHQCIRIHPVFPSRALVLLVEAECGVTNVVGGSSVMRKVVIATTSSKMSIIEVRMNYLIPTLAALPATPS